MSVLAIHGGTPVIAPGTYQRAAWPPTDEETAELVKELYLSGKWSFNSEMEQAFEAEFAASCDAKYGVFMANGTVTLECALLSLGIKPGDEVIVPGLTWMATAMAVIYVGATPVFADVDKDTCCLSAESFQKAISAKTRAVIPVHLYGSMADLEEILAIARQHDIAVIEDCAHMQGGKWNGRGAGSWGDVGSFSFQQSKTLSSGEGGICVTNDATTADLLYRAKHIGYSRMDSQGGAKTPPPPEMICHNYRGLAISALILSRQLKKLPERLQKYRQFADSLCQIVKQFPGVRIQAPGRLATTQGYYGVQVIFDPEIWGTKDIGPVFAYEGFPIFNNYGPVYKHMLFNTEKYRNCGCPNAEFLGLNAKTLLHTYMDSPDMLPVIADIFQKVYENRSQI
ncbi:MAG: DegT/DnrJ/EryC1/StrS family aminotransferase [Lentisphaeria bacterium]|nr:DegT/DnrJ/EryC1/StrS family aminotransferase [Lentisphaeria bacterium]